MARRPIANQDDFDDVVVNLIQATNAGITPHGGYRPNATVRGTNRPSMHGVRGGAVDLQIAGKVDNAVYEKMKEYANARGFYARVERPGDPVASPDLKNTIIHIERTSIGTPRPAPTTQTPGPPRGEPWVMFKGPKARGAYDMVVRRLRAGEGVEQIKASKWGEYDGVNRDMVIDRAVANLQRANGQPLPPRPPVVPPRPNVLQRVGRAIAREGVHTVEDIKATYNRENVGAAVRAVGENIAQAPSGLRGPLAQVEQMVGRRLSNAGGVVHALQNIRNPLRATIAENIGERVGREELEAAEGNLAKVGPGIVPQTISGVGRFTVAAAPYAPIAAMTGPAAPAVMFGAGSAEMAYGEGAAPEQIAEEFAWGAGMGALVGPLAKIPGVRSLPGWVRSGFSLGAASAATGTVRNVVEGRAALEGVGQGSLVMASIGSIFHAVPGVTRPAMDFIGRVKDAKTRATLTEANTLAAEGRAVEAKAKAAEAVRLTGVPPEQAKVIDQVVATIAEVAPEAPARTTITRPRLVAPKPGEVAGAVRGATPTTPVSRPLAAPTRPVQGEGVPIGPVPPTGPLHIYRGGSPVAFEAREGPMHFTTRPDIAATYADKVLSGGDLIQRRTVDPSKILDLKGLPENTSGHELTQYLSGHGVEYDAGSVEFKRTAFWETFRDDKALLAALDEAGYDGYMIDENLSSQGFKDTYDAVVLTPSAQGRTFKGRITRPAGAVEYGRIAGKTNAGIFDAKAAELDRKRLFGEPPAPEPSTAPKVAKAKSDKPYYAASGGPSGGGATTSTPRANAIPTEAATGRVEFPTEGSRNLAALYEREIGPRLRTGGLRKWLGVFSSALPPRGSVKVRTLENLRILAHETGHFIDWATGRMKLPRGSIYREELKLLTQEVNPFEEQFKHWVGDNGKPRKKQSPYTAYRYSSKELYADFAATYITSPETARRVAPEFTKFIEGEIAGKTPFGESFQYIVDRMREFNEQMQPLKEYVYSLRQIPELRPEVDAWEPKRGAITGLWQRTVGNRLWAGVEKMFDRFSKTRAGKITTERHGLDILTEQTLIQRKKLIDGQIARVGDILIDPLSKLSKADQELVADALQRADGLPANHPLRSLTEEIRREFATWGNEARKLGLLGDETFWSNVGQYFPFFYEAKEFNLNKGRFGYVNTKALRADLSSYKHRLTDAELGRKVLESRLGTWPSSKVKIEAYSRAELESIGREAREEMGLMKTAAYPTQRRLSKLIQSVYTTKALNMIAETPGIVGEKGMAGYVNLPEGNSLGNLGGRWVPENVAQEINSFSQRVDGLMKGLGAANAAWKTMKVPFDPAAQVRNEVSNAISAWMHDVPVFDPRVTGRGLKSFIGRDAVYEALRDHGLYKHTYSVEELQTLAFMLEKNPTSHAEAVAQWAIKAAKTPGDIYGFVEDANKTIIARYAMDKGATPQQAVAFADKILFDYSRVSPAVGALRRGPLPFITWSAKILPRLIETAIRRPDKYLFAYSAIAIVGALARQQLGISRKDEESMKPTYMRGRSRTLMMLPWKDANGEIQWVDGSYFVPWGGWMQPIKTGAGMPQPLQVSGPVPAIYNAYFQGFDPFSGEIAPDYMTEAEKRAARAKYTGRSLLPNIAPGGYGWSRVAKAAKGEKDYYGRKPSLTKAIARTATGISATSGGPLTTGAEAFREDEARRRIEVRRPMVQKMVDAYGSGSEAKIAAAEAALSKLSEEDQEAVRNRAEDILEKEKQRYPSLGRMSKAQREKYLDTLSAKDRAKAENAAPPPARRSRSGRNLYLPSSSRRGSSLYRGL